MANKTPTALASITLPAARTAAAHFVDSGNSRETRIMDVVQWVAVNSWTFSTNVTEVDFTGLDNYTELMVIARAITKGTTGTLNLRVSSDNGSSFYSASGDYVSVSTAGAEANLTSIPLHATNATAARSVIAHLTNFNIAAIKPVKTPTHTTPSNLITQALAMNAIRLLPSGGGNITGGSILLFGR